MFQKLQLLYQEILHLLGTIFSSRLFQICHLGRTGLTDNEKEKVHVWLHMLESEGVKKRETPQQRDTVCLQFLQMLHTATADYPHTHTHTHTHTEA